MIDPKRLNELAEVYTPQGFRGNGHEITNGEICELVQRDAARSRMKEALEAALVFVNDCIENGHDRTMLANMFSARDTINEGLRSAT